MKKKYFPWVLVMILLGMMFHGMYGYTETLAVETPVSGAGSFLESVQRILLGEPEEVRELRKKEVPQTDEGHLEYYFGLLNEKQKRAYRELLDGIRRREEEFYLTISEDADLDLTYHAVLKDHPELFWVHNREQVFKTVFSGRDYCLFTPGYMYTEAECSEIGSAMEQAYQDVLALIPAEADTYEKIKTVYTYLIDTTEYRLSEHDQSIAGVFWKKSAVCAGYAGAMQYLLERMGIFCIYVDGTVENDPDGHAWNIVQIDGEYYYVDATNGDQPQFLEGDAVQMAEHKTTICDYLCPFPEEYEQTYRPSEEFEVPACVAEDKNFYVLNNGCFDSYDWQQVYDYCKMRLNNGAAVIRFKFRNEEDFRKACEEWIDMESIQQAAQYYMQLYGMQQVEYHYGIMQNLKTLYFIF